nr:hypothetical protein [Tanacetum cinerariifolium]
MIGSVFIIILAVCWKTIVVCLQRLIALQPRCQHQWTASTGTWLMMWYASLSIFLGYEMERLFCGCGVVGVMVTRQLFLYLISSLKQTACLIALDIVEVVILFSFQAILITKLGSLYPAIQVWTTSMMKDREKEELAGEQKDMNDSFKTNYDQMESDEPHDENSVDYSDQREFSDAYYTNKLRKVNKEDR